jgi:hypothetical protein
MFVSTHSFVPATSISYDLLLPAFAGAVCARTAGPGHTMAAAPNTSAANLIAVLLFTIFMAYPCLASLPYLTQQQEVLLQDSL